MCSGQAVFIFFSDATAPVHSNLPAQVLCLNSVFVSNNKTGREILSFLEDEEILSSITGSSFLVP